MTKVLPSLYGLSIDNIKEKINDLKALGYSDKDIIKMTKVLPALYSYSIDNIKNKINDLKALGYSDKDIIKMTKVLPSLYSYSIDNIKEKKDFYDKIGLSFIIMEDTLQLIQSVNLSYARYEFYKSKGITLNKDNYKKLFISQEQFIDDYGITNKRLTEIYSYKKYKNKQLLLKYSYSKYKNKKMLG